MRKILKRIVPLSWVNKFRTAALKGDNMHCPICDGKFLTFLPFGLQVRLNARCPNCLSLERHRLFWLFLEEKALLKSEKQIRLLHVSPEPIFFKALSKNPDIDYYPGDKLEMGYQYPKGTIDLDITNINFEDNYFDGIICSHVLEHIPQDRKAMQELCRVLKPSGWALLHVPMDYNLEKTFEDYSITDPQERTKHFGQHDHVRLYGLDFKDRLEEAGFEVRIEKFTDKFSPEEKKRFGLETREDIYFSSKPVQKMAIA